MSRPIDVTGPLYRRRWLFWAIYVALWTTALVVPVPGDSFLEHVQVLRITLKFLFAKSLHALAYAGMTILTARLLLPVRYRWAAMYFLMFHAALTEFIQLHLSYRSGLVMDVLIDHIGVAVGVVVSFKYWVTPAIPVPETETHDSTMPTIEGGMHGRTTGQEKESGMGVEQSGVGP